MSSSVVVQILLDDNAYFRNNTLLLVCNEEVLNLRFQCNINIQAPANIKAGKISIDISSLAKGLYHVQLLGTDNKSLSNTFIKQ